jgi:hypothetical protein
MAAAQNEFLFVYYHLRCFYCDHRHLYHHYHNRSPLFGRNVVVD